MIWKPQQHLRKYGFSVGAPPSCWCRWWWRKQPPPAISARNTCSTPRDELRVSKSVVGGGVLLRASRNLLETYPGVHSPRAGAGRDEQGRRASARERRIIWLIARSRRCPARRDGYSGVAHSRLAGLRLQGLVMMLFRLMPQPVGTRFVRRIRHCRDDGGAFGGNRPYLQKCYHMGDKRAPMVYRGARTGKNDRPDPS